MRFTADHTRVAVRDPSFDGPGWYVFNSQYTIVAGPYETEFKANNARDWADETQIVYKLDKDSRPVDK